MRRQFEDLASRRFVLLFTFDLELQFAAFRAVLASDAMRLASVSLASSGITFLVKLMSPCLSH